MIKKFFMFVLVSALALLPSLCSAESLWGANRKGSIFQDIKARNVGDVLTIVISESSSATRGSSSKNSKSAEIGVGVGTGSFLDWITAHNANMSDSFNAAGNISNTNRFTANVTVQVVGVQPNGNLLVSGTQSIKQNKDIQTITITGEVRPLDITGNNTVLSTYVANAKIVVGGKGPLMRKQRQGIISQVLNFLF